MAVLIEKRKEAILNENLEPVIIHRETDTDCVIMPDGYSTLSEFLVNFGGHRTIVVSGDATGSVSYRPIDEGTVEVEVEVVDDSHSHTGATIIMPEKSRVIVSGADNRIVVSPVTVEELAALVGVTGNIQEQLNGKAPSDHNHDSVYVKQGQLGQAGGIVPLGSDGKIAAQYLPDSVAVQVGGSQPTDQKEGDLWFQGLS